MKSGSFQKISDREWLLTNGIGGYALGFGNMLNKRKYNGLLIAATDSENKHHILSCMEELVELEGSNFHLDSNHYANCIFPHGYAQILKTWLRPYPCTVYSTTPPMPDLMISRELFMVPGKNAVVVKYNNLGDQAIDLVVRPKFSLRNHYDINLSGTWHRTQLSYEAQENSFQISREDNQINAFGYIEDGQLWEDKAIYESIYYPTEAARGYQSVEDLISPVRIMIHLEPHTSRWMLFSDTSVTDCAVEVAKAQHHYKSLIAPEDHPENTSAHAYLETHNAMHNEPFKRTDYYQLLEVAANDFIVNKSDIAKGYPWYSFSGRNTMTCMSGLKYTSNGKVVAHQILKKYAALQKNGLIPHELASENLVRNYNSIDASLWFLIHSHAFELKNSALFQTMVDIVLHYYLDATLPFFCDEDGLLCIRNNDLALTWMDADINGKPVTPRSGKPVEVNALWYNGLCAFIEMADALTLSDFQSNALHATYDDIVKLRDQVRQSLQRFMGDDYLADRIDNTGVIWDIRPNAVIAASLPFDFLEKDQLQRIWQLAEERLLTPYGLRSLEPNHASFKQRYVGGERQRNLACHQGTVWPFLMLPFVKLALKALSNTMERELIIRRLSEYVWVFRDGFLKGEMASVAELWDGIDPYMPKGCSAYARNVFALLEIEHLLLDV